MKMMSSEELYSKVDDLEREIRSLRRRLREENIALADMTKQRNEMGAWLRQDGHECEFYIDPERGKCDWCEMMGNYFADNNIAFAEEDDHHG